jgi:hypothetical protein
VAFSGEKRTYTEEEVIAFVGWLVNNSKTLQPIKGVDINDAWYKFRSKLENPDEDLKDQITGWFVAIDIPNVRWED